MWEDVRHPKQVNTNHREEGYRVIYLCVLMDICYRSAVSSRQLVFPQNDHKFKKNADWVE